MVADGPNRKASAPSDGAIEQRILAAARAAFEHYGVQKTTMEDIASAANVSRGTVYNYFSSKEGILHAISMREVETMHDELRRRLKRNLSFADTVTEAVLITVQIARENQHIRRFVRDVELNLRSPAYALAAARWGSLLNAARESGELAGDLDMDDIVPWLLLSQRMLFAERGDFISSEAKLRSFIRRFVVEPLLRDRGAAAS